MMYRMLNGMEQQGYLRSSHKSGAEHRVFVATALGRSPEAARQIVTRARIALKQCIQERLAEP